jgi:hypothetical protein
MFRSIGLVVAAELIVLSVLGVAVGLGIAFIR